MKKRSLNLTTDILNSDEQNEIKGGGRTRHRSKSGSGKKVKIKTVS